MNSARRPAAEIDAEARARFLTGIALAGLGAILFSAKAIVAKLTYRWGIDAVTLIAFRMIFSGPFFAAVALWAARNHAPLSWPDRWRLVGMGLLGYYLSSFLDFLGLQYITAGLERLILFLTPTMVVLMTVFGLKRRITPREWGALGLSYAGIVLVFLHDAKLGGDRTWLGAGFVFAAALSYAVYLILSGEMVRRVGSVRLVAYAMCVSSVACIVQFLVLRPVSMLVQPMPVYWLSLVNALVCTVMPVFMTMFAVDRIGAPAASQMGMVGPVSTLLLGWWVLSEPITGTQLGGTALVLVGVFVLTTRRG